MFTHPTEFRHYIRLYKEGDTTYPQQDIEKTYLCRFVSMKNADQPAVRNIYTEEFAERSGCNIYVPVQSELAYGSSDIVLTLRWRSDECGNVLTYSDGFFNYISGRRLEYHDTLRPGRYWQLILRDAPKVVAEKLYGKVKYRFIEYKFYNFGGRPSTSTQIK